MYAENHDDCNACNLHSVHGHACMQLCWAIAHMFNQLASHLAMYA